MASGSSGIKSDAIASYGTNTGNAASALGTLSPLYTSMATDPQGFTPQQKANMLTASQQSLGGGMSAAVGQAGLEAARTGNVGGQTLALDDAARMAGVQQSGNALGVENQDAAIARAQQAQGLNGLSNIYGTATGAGLQYLNAANNAKPTFWQNLGSQAASAAVNAAASYGGA